MGSVALFFIGSVLLLNGLVLLGVIGSKAAAPINAFVGVFTVGVVLVTIVPGANSEQSIVSMLGAAGFLLFAITYLYVAVNNFCDSPGEGLGWYCGWAGIAATMLSAVNFVVLNDPRSGWLWFSWLFLFGAFFATSALRAERLTRPTGWFAILHSFGSTGIPGALQITGLWSALPVWTIASSQLLILATFLLVSVFSDKVKHGARAVNVRGSEPQSDADPAMAR
jgi:hypothetical protein